MTTESAPCPAARVARTPRRDSAARRRTGDRSAPAPARSLGRGRPVEYHRVGGRGSTSRAGSGWLAAPAPNRPPGRRHWLPRPSGLAAPWRPGSPGGHPREGESASWQQPDPRPRPGLVLRQEAEQRLSSRGARLRLRIRGWASAKDARARPDAWPPENGVAARERAPSTGVTIGAGAECHRRGPRSMRSTTLRGVLAWGIRRTAHPPAAWEDGQTCPCQG